MNGAQQIVGAAGVGLILANFWTGDARSVVTHGVFGNGTDTDRAHHELAVFGGELLLVGALTLLAGAGDSIGTTMVVVIVGLWILWAMHHFTGKTTGNATGGNA